VFIRAFDPHPDSFLKVLGAPADVRAANRSAEDMVDSYTRTADFWASSLPLNPPG